ncbi:MAG: 2-C-methyl-D-erythritol 4-phosphate cytidylyltransferase [Betaproteobacteria bacterium]|nr:2-C-methyl-D-erythritol 4-phosphate cytidylyltransferase [Betaproteobacteria bacterium]
MAARYFGLIPAGGRGSRFGGELPKQYQALHGRAILAYAIDALAVHTPLARVYVVHAEDDKRCVQVTGTGYRVTTMPCGGATRAASVRNGLASLRGELTDEDWVLVHDAVRPCLPKDALRRLLQEGGEDPVGGLLAIPVADTLKREDKNGRVAATEPRAGLWQAQTPQMFRYGVLWEAYQTFGGLDATDEAEAVEKIGKQPRLVLGSSANFKITFPADLLIAEAILRPAGT